jgi:tripartite-type tricarboxylate transporter receptor subunit TctC
MSSWRIFQWLLLAGLPALGLGVASAQGYPERPVRMVTAEIGGTADMVARIIAQGLTERLGQPVIVDNRGGGVIPGGIVARAQPDGYTLLYYGSTIWLAPLLQDNIPYDAVRDFAPISMATVAPNVVVVHPSVAAKSMQELLALARAQPGKLNYASGGTGAASHLAAEVFKGMAKVNIVRVPYRGNGPALNAMIAGEVQLMFATVGSAVPHIKSGRLRALAVTSARPFALLPGMPTVAASGLPGYESGSTSGLFAPARTPAAIVNRLHQETARVLGRPDIRERLASAGLEAVGSAPQELAAAMKSEIAGTGKVIRAAGIRAE